MAYAFRSPTYLDGFTNTAGTDIVTHDANWTIVHESASANIEIDAAGLQARVAGGPFEWGTVKWTGVESINQQAAIHWENMGDDAAWCVAWARLKGTSLATRTGYGMECGYVEPSGNETYKLERSDNGTKTQLGATVADIDTTSTQLGIECIGSTIRGYRTRTGTDDDWELIIEQEDDTYREPGNPGWELGNDGTPDVAIVDDFRGEALPDSEPDPAPQAGSLLDAALPRIVQKVPNTIAPQTTSGITTDTINITPTGPNTLIVLMCANPNGGFGQIDGVTDNQGDLTLDVSQDLDDNNDGIFIYRRDNVTVEAQTITVTFNFASSDVSWHVLEVTGLRDEPFDQAASDNWPPSGTASEGGTPNTGTLVQDINLVFALYGNRPGLMDFVNNATPDYTEIGNFGGAGPKYQSAYKFTSDRRYVNASWTHDVTASQDSGGIVAVYRAIAKPRLRRGKTIHAMPLPIRGW